LWIAKLDIFKPDPPLLRPYLYRFNDPLKTCTGHTIGEINHEYDDGRRYQEVDGQAQGGFGDGDYSRKDFDLREASRAFDVSPAEIEEWVDEAKRGMENALRAKPLDIKEQYERQLKELQEAYGEAMLELRARNRAVAMFR
jgi:hypothetical protein